MSNLKFIEDKNFKYTEKIKNKLNKFNQSQAGYKEKDIQNFYVLDDEVVKGVIHTYTYQDWCHIESLYYQDILVLKTLINDVKNYYEDSVEGIQFNCVISDRVKDFKALGFIEKGRLEDMPKGKDNVFLITTDFNEYDIEEDFNVQSSEENIKAYDRIMKQENKKLRKSLNFSSKVVDVQFVALDDGEFAGGIYGNYQYDYLFINILYVDKEYRGQQIATKLMKLIEDHAREKGVYNLYITTFEFQALGLYQKLGYEIVMEIYDYPVGYKEYTVYKHLNK
jgi:GNAT superfamily N-acetyltransferase